MIQKSARRMSFEKVRQLSYLVQGLSPGIRKNPKVIRKLSVGHSEKKTILLEWPARRKVVRKRKKEVKLKTIKRKKKANRTLFYFSCFFSTNFRRLTKSSGRTRRFANRCDGEEDASSIRVRRERRRQKRKVVDGRRRRKKDERWRSATGKQNLLDRREALQMRSETRQHDHRQKNTSTSTKYLFRRRCEGCEI